MSTTPLIHKEGIAVLPEFIQGLATKKSQVLQRREVIKKEYLRLLDKLGKKNGKNKKIVRNDFLDVDVFFVMREGGSEATMRSSYNWQSAYAVLNLETVVKKATAKEGLPVYTAAKPTGKQKNLEYVNIATLYYEFVNPKKWYLNFTVKLVLGVKNNGKHVQYSVTKIDVI